MGADLGQTEKDRDDAKQRKERRFSSGKFYSTTSKDSPHTIRLLPPGYDGQVYVPGGRIFMPVFTHTAIPNTSVTNRFTKEKQRAAAICVKHSFPERDETCVLCEVASEMYNKMKSLGLTEKQRDRVIGKYYLAKKAYANMVAREGDETIRVEYGTRGKKIRIPKIYIVGFSPTVREWIDDKMSLKKKGTDRPVYGDITDPENGIDLIIEVEGTGMKTKYSCSLAAERTPLDEDERKIDAILRNCFDMTKEFPFPSSKQLNEIRVFADAFEGYLGDMEEVAEKGGGDDDDDGDERTERRSRRNSRYAKDDEDEKGGGDDEDDEDERPRKSKQSISSSSSRAKGGKPRNEDGTTCFGNFVPGKHRCLQCPVQPSCMASEKSQTKPVRQKKRAHVRIWGD